MKRDGLLDLIKMSALGVDELLEVNDKLVDDPMTREEFKELWNLYRDVATRRIQ